MTDAGPVRRRNEDHFLIGDLRKALVLAQTSLPTDDNAWYWGAAQRLLMVVADGVTAAPKGERASMVATATVANQILHTMPWFLSLRPDNDDDIEEELKRALGRGHEAVAAENNEYDVTPATTLTMAYVLWPRLYVVHAGDSRCYLHRGQELLQLTTDHTFAQRLAEEGIATGEAAERRWSHVLWNTLGGEEDGVVAEVSRATLHAGDTLLLSTDGLHEAMPDDAIAAHLAKAESAEAASRALVSEAIRRETTDNVTAVVARFGLRAGTEGRS